MIAKIMYIITPYRATVFAESRPRSSSPNVAFEFQDSRRDKHNTRQSEVNLKEIPTLHLKAFVFLASSIYIS